MKNANLTIAVAAASLMGASVTAQAANNSRVTNPNALGVEIGGRGLLYSVNFDRVLSDELLVGVGFGTVSMSDKAGNSTGLSATLIPVYLHYYFMREMGSFYATVGATLAANASSVSGLQTSVGALQLGSTPVIPTAGVGYEYRSDPGFLVRVTAYLMGGQNFVPWGGFSVGYSF